MPAPPINAGLITLEPAEGSSGFTLPARALFVSPPTTSSWGKRAFFAPFSAMFALSLPQADGCASLPPLDGSSIHIAEESAIVVWDPVKKVQHFIRRAAFDTKSPDFGFLVPSYSGIKAKLAAAMKCLSPRERIVFEMKHYQGLKLRAIGDALGTSE